MIFKVIGRLTAAFFGGIGKAFFTTSRSVRRHPTASLIIAVVAFAAFIGLYFTNFLGLTDGNFLGTGGNSSVITISEQRPEPDGKSNAFLNALKDANGTALYDLMDNDYKAAMKRRGIPNGSVAQGFMQAKLEDYTGQKNGKVKYSFVHLRNLRYSDGSAEDAFQGTAQAGTQKDDFFFVFKIKKDKIIDVQTSELVTIAALGIDKAENTDKPQPGVLTRNASSNAEKFMAGLTTFNADLVWDSLADSYKEQLGKAQPKVDKDYMTKVFDEVRTVNAEGAKTGNSIGYGGFAHRETVNFPNGTSLNDFEAVQSISGNASVPGYHIFLDGSNKIIGIGNFNSADQIFSRLLGRGQNG